MKSQSIFNPIPVLLMFSLSMMLLLLSASSGMATPSSSDELHLEQPVLSLEDEAENDSLPANESAEDVEVDVLLDSSQIANLPHLLNALQRWQAEGKVSEFELVGQNRLRLFSDSSTIEALRALPTVSEVVASEEGSRSLSTADGSWADFLPSSEPFADSSRTLYAEGHDFLEEGSEEGELATEATRQYWLILELNHPMKQLSAELSEALEHLKGEGMVLDVEPTLEESNILKVVATTKAYSTLKQLPTVSAVALSAPLLSPRSRSNGEGSIAGTVTDADGTPLEGIHIRLLFEHQALGSWVWFHRATTNSEGEYTVTLSGGDGYRVKFDDPAHIYVNEYYDNASDFESASDIEVIAGETTTDIDAQLDEGGHITGRVSDENGNPIEDISVRVYGYDEQRDDWRWAGSASTTADGSYDAGGLQSGSYRVGFEDSQSRYRSEFYDDVLEIEDGSDVLVTLGETTPNIDASLQELGHITGTVLNDSGSPLANIEVTAYEYSQRDGYWHRLNDDYTDAQGQYQISGLDTGSYRLRFSDLSGDYLRQYYQNATDVESATNVSVIASEITPNIDAQLQKAGRITGIVGAATISLPNPKPPTTNLGEHQLYLPLMLTAISNPLVDIEVRVYQYNEEGNRWQQKGEDSTNTNGRYDINGLDSGTYRLVFFDQHDRYLANYYKDGVELDKATDVEVVAGQTTARINQLLDEGGKITGAVTDANNNPVPNLEGYLYHYNDERVDWREHVIETDFEGSYSIGGLETGDYRVCFANNSAIYLPKCYDEVTDFDSASTIEVTQGETSADINVRLDKGGEIDGTVTNSEGQPLPDIEVITFWHDEEADRWASVERDYTDENGQYQVKGLKSGTYRLFFDDWNDNYLFEYYGETTDFNQATNLSVTIEETLTNIDAQLNDAGSISGLIRGADGELLRDGVAEAYGYNENEKQWQWINYDYTDSAGAYTIKGLDSDSYRIRFSDDSGENLPEYYLNATDLESATDVSVIAGQTTLGIDGDLAKSGSITGVVRNTEGNPVGDRNMTAYQYYADDNQWKYISSSTTSFKGEYEVKGLSSGTYRLLISGLGRTYLSEYYDNASDFESATDIEVTVGQATTGIDIELDRGGRLTGTVTNANGEPLRRVTVYAYRYNSDTAQWNRVEYDSTNHQGEYEIKYLRTGSYRVKFVSEEENYAPEYYGNAPDLESATTIMVTANQTTSNIDTQLAEGGQIRGVVTDADGQPLRWVTVSAYQYDDDKESWQVVRYGYSSLYGKYEIKGLQTGSYRVGFSQGSEKHVTQYYDNVTDIDEALDLSVTAGETITDINASLDKGGRIIGQISSTNGWKLRSIRITAYQYDEQEETWQAINADSTNSQGYYNLGALATGSYRLHFQNLGEWIVYAPEYYNDVLDLESATDVEVVAEQTTADIDAELDRGGRLRGTVSNANGNPLDSIWVRVLEAEPDSNQWKVINYELTDDSGQYDISALNPGNYRLQFDDYRGLHATEYYNNVRDIELAQDISLMNDEIIENLDASLDRAGYIRGTVTDSDGAMLWGIEVTAYQYDESLASWQERESSHSSYNGEYTVRGLSAGTYRLRFNDSQGNYVTQYYDGADNLENATDISVTAGQTTTGIDSQLAKAAQITGRRQE